MFGTIHFAFAAGPRPLGPGRSATRPAGLRARASAGVRAWVESAHAQAACPARLSRLLVQPDHGPEMDRAAPRGNLTPVPAHSAGGGSGTAP